MFMREALFADRTEAGRRLAEGLLRFKGERPVVSLCRAAACPWASRSPERSMRRSTWCSCKIGAPFQPELAVGAVVDGGRAETVLNEELICEFQFPESWVAEESARQLYEIERRRALYLAGRTRAPVEGQTAIVVDDGVATAATMEAALHATRRARPKRLVLAVPVAAPDTIERLRPQVDEVVCLAMPRAFAAIGWFYKDFRQLSDEEVIDLLERATRVSEKPVGP